MDEVSPPLAPSQGREQETTSAEMTMRRHEQGAMDEVSPPLAPSQGLEQETTSAEMTMRRHEQGAMDEVSPPLSPSQGREQERTSAKMTRRCHEAGRHGRSFPSSRSQSGTRAGDDVRRDDGATARGRAPWTRFPLLSLPVRDASRRRPPPR